MYDNIHQPERQLTYWSEAENEFTSTVDYQKSDEIFKIFKFDTPYKTAGVFGNTDQCP